MVLGMVFGVSVILYIFDVSRIPSSTQVTPTISIPTIVTTQQISITPTSTTVKKLSETIEYSVRSTPESMKVNILINGSTIADLQLSQFPGSQDSKKYQDAFAAEIESYVVGKNINEIQVSRIAGASYTTDAFMQALDKMKSQI